MWICLAPTPACAETVESLRAQLASPDHAVRQHALLLYREPGLHDPRIIESLVHVALADPDEGLRASANLLLQEMGAAGAPAIPLLVQAIGDAQWERRRNALASLYEMRPEAPLPTAVDAAAGALRDTSSEVRRWAMYALEVLRPPTLRSVAALIAAVQHPDDGFSVLGMTAILRGSGPLARAALTPLLHDPDRTRQALALVAMPIDSVSTPAFLALARDTSLMVRTMALSWLAELDPRPDAVDSVLAVARQDPDEELRMISELELASNPDTARTLCHIQTGKPVATRDTTAFAFGVEASRYREPTLKEAINPFGGETKELGTTFDLVVYDMARHAGPRTVARWTVAEKEHISLVGWDADGILVEHRIPGPVADSLRAEWVDPATGSRRDFGRATERELSHRFSALNSLGSGWDELRRTHVTEEAGEFYVWHPATRAKEFLFQLSDSVDGTPDPDRSQLETYRRRNAVHNAILRIWDATTTQDADSARFVVDTYAPVPGKAARPYVLRFRVEMPDVPQEAHQVFGSVFDSLATVRRVLGPRGGLVRVTIPMRRLREMLARYARSQQVHAPGYDTAVWINLDPELTPQEASLGRFDRPSGDGSPGYTRLVIPVR